jgi:hypothetical protein
LRNFKRAASKPPRAKTPRHPGYLRFGRRIWRHPSVLALIADEGRQDDPVAIIRKRARALVAEAREFGWSGPPFDPHVLASFRGIRLSPDRLAPGHDAFIIPRDGRKLEIVFDIARPATRQNFSICHEISHTLFPDGYEMIRNRYERRDKFDPDQEVEHLCDVGAAEILLPEGEFRADVDRYGFGLASVVPLRERYAASREAVIRRMIQLDGARSAAIFLEYRLKPSERGAERQLTLLGDDYKPQPKLRIAYAVVSDAFGVFLPRHKSVPETSCVYRAVLTGLLETGVEAWGIPGLPSCKVEAMAMPSGDAVDTSVRAVALVRF